jgi:hypothetical protein
MFTPGNLLYCMLYDKQGKYKEAKDILSDCPNESGPIIE